ncbi:hypothetical protein [Halorarum salinum]|uniref:Uncharacterized protein n=1 Tax=Halorarum salinum TaxID=2743089 RepID=A0A7D5LED1_9EURY|nr:hypothetical protein [Halobaculum salinum]QLG63915.1 hypothetical protein HUG12_20200 [Halobaculum salinum]
MDRNGRASSRDDRGAYSTSPAARREFADRFVDHDPVTAIDSDRQQVGSWFPA